jgi:hypothetical protein
VFNTDFLVDLTSMSGLYTAVTNDNCDVESLYACVTVRLTGGMPYAIQVGVQGEARGAILLEVYCAPGSVYDTTISACNLCSPGEYSALGDLLCSICPADHYSGQGAGQCSACPEGYTSGAHSEYCIPPGCRSLDLSNDFNLEYFSDYYDDISTVTLADSLVEYDITDVGPGTFTPLALYGPGGYPTQLFCSWRLKAPPGLIFSMAIEALDTREGHDFLSVLDGDTPLSTPLANMVSGSLMSQSLSSSTQSHITIVFNSEFVNATSFLGYTGFTLTFLVGARVSFGGQTMRVCCTEKRMRHHASILAMVLLSWVRCRTPHIF